MRGIVRLLVAVVLHAALAACSTSADSTPTSKASLMPSGSVVEGSGIPASSAAGPTPSVVDPSTFVSTSAGGVSVAPLPAGLTEEQASDARAALEVYERYWALADEAGAAPGIDRTDEVSGIAVGSAAELFSQNDKFLVTNGYRMVGSTTVEAHVTKVEPALVYVTACVDVSRTDVLDRNGNSLGADDGPGSYVRFNTSAQIGQYVGGRWLVTIEEIDRDTTC